MARPPKTKIEIFTDGTHRGTKVAINGATIKPYGLSLSGNRDTGYKLVMDLTDPGEAQQNEKEC